MPKVGNENEKNNNDKDFKITNIKVLNENMDEKMFYTIIN